MVVWVVYIGYLCCIVVSVFFNICKASEPYLVLSNNGPAILESNITFSAYLMEYSREETLYYTFDDGTEKTNIDGGTNVSLSRLYSRNNYSEGWYNMTVTVERQAALIIREKIATNYTSFQLGENLFGNIVVLRDSSYNNEAEEVGTGENLTMIAEIHDANGYLKDAHIECVWSIDMDRHYHKSTNFNYTYTDPGVSSIAVSVFAKFPSSDVAYGLFTKELDVKVPVNGISVSGNPFLHHDQVMHLNISCNGTPPFEYCWDILNSNETVENNFTCTVIVTNTCFFPINRYFQKDGKYQIAIHISNDVKLVKRNLEIVVYSVPTKPQLSTVIIPIVCSLLTLIIIAIGITYYRQQRRQLIVEVASFDFHDDSETYPESTFFEQLWDSFRCRRCCSPAASVKTDALPSEIEPLLT